MQAKQEPPLVRAARKERVERTPVWFMRQAGRVLPEYRQIRTSHSLLDICRQADLAATVTLQPVERFDVDAAIIFADIITPLLGVGLKVDIVEKVGPVLDEPIRSRADLARLRCLEPEQDLPAMLEALRLVRNALPDEKALIGFAGAPFTLATYLIEGGPSKNYTTTKSLMYSQPDFWHELMTRLSDMIVAYLLAQASAGAQVLQLFDSWVGWLSQRDYCEYVFPYTARIIKAAQTSGVPVIHFATGAGALNGAIMQAAPDVVGLDWRVPLDESWAALGDVAVQGQPRPGRAAGAC